jgi:hypothetical protein
VLGWKARTFASNPDRREDRRIVVIVVAEESTPLHEELVRIRREKKMRVVMESWSRDLGL